VWGRQQLCRGVWGGERVVATIVIHRVCRVPLYIYIIIILCVGEYGVKHELYKSIMCNNDIFK